MTTENASQQSATPQRKPLGAQIMPDDSIPNGIVAAVHSKLGPDAKAVPAREDGGYKGKVIYANDSYIVQAVGKDEKSAVVHRAKDVELVGQKLNWRAENKMLGNVDLQVHYSGSDGKGYVWNREREQAARDAKAQEKAAAPAAKAAEPAKPAKAAEPAKAPKAAKAAEKPDKAVEAAAKPPKAAKAPKAPKKREPASMER